MVSIIVPVIRPERAEECFEAIMRYGDCDYEIVSEIDEKRIGVAKMVKRLVEKSKGQQIMFLGDDTVPQKGFLKEALKAMTYLEDGWGMVTLNDGRNINWEGAHFLLDKRMIPLIGGEVFHLGYKHCFCDAELSMRARLLGRYCYAKKAIIKHNHPILDKSVKTDNDYTRVYGREVWEHDKNLFDKRRLKIIEEYEKSC